MTIGNRVLELLNQKGLKQKDLASYLGTKPSTVNGWKEINRNPSSELIVRICEFLGVSYEYLLTGKESQLSSNDRSNSQITTAFIHVKLNNDWDNFEHSIWYIPHKGDTISFSNEGPVYEVDETLFNYFECTYEVEIFVHQIRP